MRSPEELSRKYSRQWENADLRETRLLGGEHAWPISLPIGRPKPGAIANELDTVRQHFNAWRKIRIGEVVWESVRYRATSEPIDVPVRWVLRRPNEWLTACADKTVRSEFATLSDLIEQCDPVFHSLLVRRRSLWRVRPTTEVLQATQLALEVTPGCAQGKPLRALSIAGIDTKFFERNDRLITALLDARFDGEVSRIGLEPFLGAAAESDHWLLVADLDGKLLPFRKQRVPSFELKESGLPAPRILIVENESSLHQLPECPDTIAVLGAGFDLSWVEAEWLREKQVAYWGDIDTWGLQFLAKARAAIPNLTALMMTREDFDAHQSASVPEPVIAGEEPPPELNSAEQSLYRHLVQQERGRLEQEFIEVATAREAILRWVDPI